MTIKFEAVFIRDPISAKSDDWHKTAHEWRVSINGEDFPYWTGQGWREPFPHSKADYNRLKNQNRLDELLKISKPKPPSLDDVLHSLVMDASAEEEGFEDWCADLGFDPDSRKALETYLTCQNNVRRLRKTGINIAAERERLSDY